MMLLETSATPFLWSIFDARPTGALSWQIYRISQPYQKQQQFKDHGKTLRFVCHIAPLPHYY